MFKVSSFHFYMLAFYGTFSFCLPCCNGSRLGQGERKIPRRAWTADLQERGDWWAGSGDMRERQSKNIFTKSIIIEKIYWVQRILRNMFFLWIIASQFMPFSTSSPTLCLFYLPLEALLIHCFQARLPIDSGSPWEWGYRGHALSSRRWDRNKQNLAEMIE